TLLSSRLEDLQRRLDHGQGSEASGIRCRPELMDTLLRRLRTAKSTRARAIRPRAVPLEHASRLARASDRSSSKNARIYLGLSPRLQTGWLFRTPASQAIAGAYDPRSMAAGRADDLARGLPARRLRTAARRAFLIVYLREDQPRAVRF